MELYFIFGFGMLPALNTNLITLFCLGHRREMSLEGLNRISFDWRRISHAALSEGHLYSFSAVIFKKPSGRARGNNRAASV
jgi:hypothetical protein